MRKTLLSFTVLCATLMAPLALHAPRAQEAAATTARVIVTYKADSALGRKRALSGAAASADANAGANAEPHAEHASALGQRVGLALRAGADVAERSHVVFASGISSAQLAARLAADADVESAEPDRRRHRLAAPSDPLYPTGQGGDGPTVGQWYLRAPAGAVRSAINVEPAWNVSKGSPGIVVAVLDSGVRFDHPDLKAFAAGGNLLPGYDMIADAAIANDGGGRDADPSDPGDWVDAADIASGRLGSGCTSADIFESSWHGTQVSALIGALTNNGTGMASVGRQVRILPVRVLGKCGGFDSDIIPAIRWAAGLTVAGLPVNANPARVINLSLGGATTCSPDYQSAINDVIARGAVVVASAGNSDGSPVSSPANCVGVIAVAGLRHTGTKVDFSDIGPEIAISAPGGNCAQAQGECLYPILTASNTGLTTPVAATYTTGFGIPSLGTSFSAPLVAGTAALMLAAEPGLTPARVRTLLQTTARAFPSSGGAPGLQQCAPPQAGVTQLECYCSTATCGAGMLDTGAALQAVLAETGVVANIDVVTASPSRNLVVDLSAAGTALGAGRSIAGYLWQVTDTGGIVTNFSSANNAATAAITPTAGGRFGVSLTVTDDRGAASVTTASVFVRGAAPVPAPIDEGSGGGALGAAWLALLLAATLSLRRTT